jgi:hypothetical protein
MVTFDFKHIERKRTVAVASSSESSAEPSTPALPESSASTNHAFVSMCQTTTISRRAATCLTHILYAVHNVHVVVRINDLKGNHVIQKCLFKIAPKDNQVLLTHCHGNGSYNSGDSYGQPGRHDIGLFAFRT